MDLDRASFFWNYLSAGQRGLIEGGKYLLEDTKNHPDTRITDYSYLVFPFAKAYEGFLKKVFLDLDFISLQDYESNHFRIGRVLNPHLEKRMRKWSVYDKVVRNCGGVELADELWEVWKQGRNLVFHYFPHNLRALKLDEAEEIIERMLQVMQNAVRDCKIKA